MGCDGMPSGSDQIFRGVAQLVARLVRDQEVVGSNPVTPTISSVLNQPESWMRTLDFFLPFLPLCMYEQESSCSFLLCRLCVRNIFHGNALAGFLAIILLSRKTRQFQIAAGMFEILKQNVTADKSGLYRSLAAQCGVTRVGKAINEAMDAALNVLLQNNSIVTDGDQISLK